MDKQNIKAIQEALITDMQRRIFKQYNARKDEFMLTDEDYDVLQSALVDDILHCDNMKDVNNLLTEYHDLYTTFDDLIIPTVDGTLNYVVGLLVEQLPKHEPYMDNFH